LLATTYPHGLSFAGTAFPLVLLLVAIAAHASRGSFLSWMMRLGLRHSTERRKKLSVAGVFRLNHAVSHKLHQDKELVIGLGAAIGLLCCGRSACFGGVNSVGRGGPGLPWIVTALPPRVLPVNGFF
jgi:hypothetical protein